MAQKDKVRTYIERFGSISPLEAFKDLGITKLATVIGYLKREDGLKVYQKYCKTENRFGETCYYMRYWLDEKKYLKDTEVYKKEKEIDNNVPGMFWEG